MLEALIARAGWIAAALWAALYVSDYYLTIWAAKVYDAGANQHLVFFGSYELTPVFQEDVDHRRLLSTRFLFYTSVSSAVVLFFWYYAVYWGHDARVFSGFLGLLVGVELVVHMRHVRNLAVFYSLRKPGAVVGRIVYSRKLSLRLSAIEIASFAVLFGLLWLAVGGAFLVGAILGCGLQAVQHWRLMKRTRLELPDDEQACA